MWLLISSYDDFDLLDLLHVLLFPLLQQAAHLLLRLFLQSVRVFQFEVEP